MIEAQERKIVLSGVRWISIEMGDLTAFLAEVARTGENTAHNAARFSPVRPFRLVEEFRSIHSKIPTSRYHEKQQARCGVFDEVAPPHGNRETSFPHVIRSLWPCSHHVRTVIRAAPQSVFAR